MLHTIRLRFSKASPIFIILAKRTDRCNLIQILIAKWWWTNIPRSKLIPTIKIHINPQKLSLSAKHIQRKGNFPIPMDMSECNKVTITGRKEVEIEGKLVNSGKAPPSWKVA